MHSYKTRGDVSELRGLMLGASGAGGVPSQADRVENKIIAIQECRADLQDFLQRTRDRLQAIAENVNECFENLSDEIEAGRILRGADSGQALKPLPIMTPAVQRRTEYGKVGDSSKGLRSLHTSEQNHTVVHASDELLLSDLAPAGVATNPQRQTFNASSDDGRATNTEVSESDWSVSNAFDRNAYYGPTDFALMPEESGHPEATQGYTCDEHAPHNAFCNGTPPIEFGRTRALSGRKTDSSPLHLANQIRHN